MIDFDTLFGKMYASELSKPDEVIGCSQSEIAAIETKFGLKLPASYKAFLQRMGKCAGWLLEGSDFYYPDLLECRKAAEDLLRDDPAFELSGSDFVFLQHQGYQFLFFDTAGTADPAVFRFVEGDKQPLKVADSFSDWLATVVTQESKLNEKVKGSRPL